MTRKLVDYAVGYRALGGVNDPERFKYDQVLHKLRHKKRLNKAEKRFLNNIYEKGRLAAAGATHETFANFFSEAE